MSSNAHSYGDVSSSSAPSAGPRDSGGTSDGSQAAARLLEMTANEAAQWRSDAELEAAAIVAGAREEAAKLVDVARAEAHRVREETAADRARHDEEVARLERVAADYRLLLRTHLTEMLERVDGSPGSAA